MARLAVVRRLVQAQAAARARSERQMLARLRALYAGFDGWYSTPLVDEAAEGAVDIVQASTRQVAQFTDAYLARVATEVRGRQVAPAGVVDTTRLRPVEPLVPYQRPAETFRCARSRDAPPDVAQTRTIARLEKAAVMDQALAMREQARSFSQKRQVRYQRRVFFPERSAEGTCGLCIVASDRLYGPRELMPLHMNCKCEVVPVYALDEDPGSRINEDDIAAVYGQAGSTKYDDLIKVRVKVRQHSELGPVLTDGAHEWRGPDDLTAT